MNKIDLFISFNEIDENLLKRSEFAKQRSKSSWIKWMAVAACFCITIGGIVTYYRLQIYQNSVKGTLIGDTEIYPTVMVDGELYEWHKGAAIFKELPEDCDLYGNINHTGKETPQNDCEFVSVFWAEGQIYTTKDKNCIYLKLTTGWLDNAVVKFDLVKTKDGH